MSAKLRQVVPALGAYHQNSWSYELKKPLGQTQGVLCENRTTLFEVGHLVGDHLPAGLAAAADVSIGKAVGDRALCGLGRHVGTLVDRSEGGGGGQADGHYYDCEGIIFLLHFHFLFVAIHLD